MTGVMTASEKVSDTVCPACNWSTSRQRYCSYSSHVKLFYGAGDQGPPKIEVQNIEFLEQHTTIPIPSVIEEWTDDSDRYFILMNRLNGQTIEEARPTLSQPQKEHIADQVAEYIQQL
ncbi:Aminoglycoside 3'-phosphotransferase and Choline Kinase family protein [Aspergillus parasiticus SU-1]|uniref:Aminoglycoside 3'-phosphotransferase and Choline Kinase family protein n=1 Tax=Aspergillus parasiticus (strain ATCC 56775 / NRRL 5862 / SRRC 143 / SU-1) TaxID=1403190 RepID=A0A0F0I8G4_ASPPU|nr:Aminoglycoside 3'-phosphotransferase and Choline Kinase family protein [Aspergillus parasiticus SU-1]